MPIKIGLWLDNHLYPVLKVLDMVKFWYILTLIARALSVFVFN
jgi:hypothetical protein